MHTCTKIQKMTQIPQTNEDPRFLHIKDLNLLEKNRIVKKLKSPQNESLYHLEDTGTTSQGCNNVSDGFTAQNLEIISLIREANCGINYSNEELEKQWKSRQREVNLNLGTNTINKSSATAEHSDTDSALSMTDNNTNKKKSIEEEEYILRKCRLNKNAVVRGLLKTHMISLKDLQLPNDSTSDKHKNSNIALNECTNLQTNTNEPDCMTLVPCPDEPEVFIHPLLAYGTIDETKYKNIDFTVPHIGKKKIVTPRQYFISIDDSELGFVKKKTNREQLK